MTKLALDLMSSPVVTIRLGETVGRAAEVMLEHNISALPVLDDDRKLVGIISRHDLLKLMVDGP